MFRFDRKLATRYDPRTRTTANACAASVFTVGKIANHSPAQGGTIASSHAISVVESQCASGISRASSPTITTCTTPSMTPVATSIFL